MKLYRDTKETVWKRDTFDIDADSIEEAVNKILDCDVYPTDSDFLAETEEPMSPADNGGYSTEQIWDNETYKTVYSNGTK